MPSGSQSRAIDVLHSYRWYGALAGALAGGLIGVSVAGPNFYQWAPWQSVSTLLGCVLLLALSGYVAVALAIGSMAGGATAGAHTDGDTTSPACSGGESDGGGSCGGE